MAKPEWGIKRTCQSCAAAFYDLKRSPIVCPKCGAQYDPEAVLKSRRGRAAQPEEVKPVPVVVEQPEPEAAEPAEAKKEEGAEEEAQVLEDASDLGEDEDDLGEVIEHVEGEEEKE